MTLYYSNSGYAGFWIRALARLIDNLLFGVFIFVLFLLFFGLDSTESIGTTTFSWFMIAFLIASLFLISYLVALFYTAIIALYMQFILSNSLMDFADTKYFIAKVLLFLIISLVTYTLYHILFNIRGGTPGKIATGLTIRQEEGNESLTFGKALGRFFALEVISGIAFGLGFIWSAWDNKRQTWHDKLARTLVFCEQDDPPPPPPPPPPPKNGKTWGELVFFGGRMNGKHYSLKGNRVMVGRGEGAAIVINDPDKRVSRQQFEIFNKDSRYFVRNLSTKADTLINGSKMQGDMPLRENDVLSVYDYKMKIKFFN
jgi:uncharacterized RDD family membrane protein YckC